MTRRFPIRRWSWGCAPSGLPVFEIDLDFVPADVWIGAFLKPTPAARIAYVCLLPTICLRFSLMRKAYRQYGAAPREERR